MIILLGAVTQPFNLGCSILTFFVKALKMVAVRTHSHVAMMMILEGNPSRYRAIYPAVLGQPSLQQLCFKQVDGLINLMTSFYSSFLTSIFVRWGFPRSFEKKKKERKNT